MRAPTGTAVFKLFSRTKRNAFPRAAEAGVRGNALCFFARERGRRFHFAEIFRPGASPLGLVNFTVFPSATLPSMISFASGVSISF